MHDKIFYWISKTTKSDMYNALEIEQKIEQRGLRNERVALFGIPHSKLTATLRSDKKRCNRDLIKRSSENSARNENVCVLV